MQDGDVKTFTLSNQLVGTIKIMQIIRLPYWTFSLTAHDDFNALICFGTLLYRDSFTRCRQFKWHKVHLNRRWWPYREHTNGTAIAFQYSLFVDKIISYVITADRYTVRMLNDILLNTRMSRSIQWTWANLPNKNIAYNLLSIILRMLWEWECRPVAPHKKKLKKHFAKMYCRRAMNFTRDACIIKLRLDLCGRSGGGATPACEHCASLVVVTPLSDPKVLGSNAL